MASDRTSPAQPTLGEQTRRRVVVHLIPYLFFLYILAYIDRTNVSVAKLGMQKDPSQGGLGFSEEVIGFGAGIFFWGYWILEIPSTLSVLRWGARWVFVRILILWGACCCPDRHDRHPVGQPVFGWLPSFHPDPAVNQFYFLRFMLGFFEGGFFPSVILYLSLWFPPRDRAQAIAVFMAAIPVSSLLGSPISGLMLQMDGSAWRGGGGSSSSRGSPPSWPGSRPCSSSPTGRRRRRGCGPRSGPGSWPSWRRRRPAGPTTRRPGGQLTPAWCCC